MNERNASSGGRRFKAVIVFALAFVGVVLLLVTDHQGQSHRYLDLRFLVAVPEAHPKGNTEARHCVMPELVGEWTSVDRSLPENELAANTCCPKVSETPAGSVPAPLQSQKSY